MLYPITKAIANIQDSLDDSATSNWCSADHKVLNKIKACAKWAVVGMADAPTCLGLLMITAVGIVTVQQKFGKK